MKHKNPKNLSKIAYLLVLIVILMEISLISADWSFNNRKSGLIKGEGISDYGKIEIDDWFGLKKLESIELKKNTESCPSEGCSADTEIIMYENGALFDGLRFIDLNTGRETNIKNYELYVDGKEYNGEGLKGNSNGIKYNLELRGNLYPFQRVDWQIKAQGMGWIDEWATWTDSLTNGSIAAWTFNENSGTNVPDYFGYYDLTTNSTEWTTGILGNSLNFNYSGYKAYNDTFLDKNMTDLSFSFWFNPNDWFNSTKGQIQPIFSKQDVVDNQRLVAWLYVDGKLSIMSTGGIIASSNQSHWEAGEWHHVAVIWSAANDNLTLWMDGEFNHSIAQTNTLNTTILEEDFMIGREDKNNRQYNGSIDEFFFWNRSLTVQEITDLYSLGIGLSPALDPNVTLNTPTNWANVTTLNITLNCSAMTFPRYNITNISLYHNETGIWALNQTYIGGLYETDSAVFNINFTDYKSILWNCYACNNNSMCAYSSNNNTLTMDKVIINSTIYNQSTYETSSESFVLNITGDGAGALTANLIYNGTTYSGTKTGNNYNAQFSRTLEVPEGVGNNTVYWEINYGGSSYKNSSVVNQSVEQILFGICNSTLKTTFLNITFKDELDLSKINATIPSSSWSYHFGTGSTNKTYFFINNTANYEYDFCAIPNRTFHILPYVQYSSEGYPQRIWNPTLLDYTNITANQTLYLLSSTDGIYVTFQIINLAEQAIEGVSVTVVRSISGSDITIATGVTNAAGAVTFWLNPDYIYDFTFAKSGYETFESSFAPTQTIYTLTASRGTFSFIIDYSRGVSYSLTPNEDFLDKWSLQNFTFTISSSYWVLDSFSADLYFGNGTLIDSDSSSDNGGTLSFLNINVSNQSSVYMNYSYTINSTNQFFSRVWLIQSTEGRDFSMFRFFTDLAMYVDSNMYGIMGESGEDTFGKSLISFVILVVVSAGLTYRYGIANEAAIMGIIFGIVLFLDYGLGFIPAFQVGDLIAIENFYSYVAFLILTVFIIREERG